MYITQYGYRRGLAKLSFANCVVMAHIKTALNELEK